MENSATPTLPWLSLLSRSLSRSSAVLQLSLERDTLLSSQLKLAQNHEGITIHPLSPGTSWDDLGFKHVRAAERPKANEYTP